MRSHGHRQGRSFAHVRRASGGGQSCSVLAVPGEERLVYVQSVESAAGDPAVIHLEGEAHARYGL